MLADTKLRNLKPQGKLGSKQRIVVDARGIVLVITVTGANRHNSMASESTFDAIPAVAGLNGQPCKRPGKLHADKGYDFAPLPALVEQAWHQGPYRAARRRT